MSDDFDKLKDEDAFDRLKGEPGHAGFDPYAGGPAARQPPPVTGPPTGTVADALKTWADKAALSAGPQIEGAMAAMLQPALNNEEASRALWHGRPPRTDMPSAGEAYESVRNMGEAEHAASEATGLGRLGGTIGTLSTPVPVKPLGPGASAGAKAVQGAKVGAPLGLIRGAVDSPGDLTKMDTPNLKRVVADALLSGLGGGAGGAVVGGVMGKMENASRSAARRLPMDILGVSEPARRSMQRQGIYDEAGDELLALTKPIGGGMRKATLTEAALAELKRRGENLDDVISGIDKASPLGVSQADDLAAAVRDQARPFMTGGLHQKQIAGRMEKEAANIPVSLGPSGVSLSDLERFKQNFSQAVAKDLKHAGEPAARTTALAETYRALKSANEAAAEVAAAQRAPELAGKFMPAKRAYGLLAAPLEGANVERAGLHGSDFALGELLGSAPPGTMLSKLTEGLPFAGLVKAPLDIAGRAYGRGVAANAAELLANRLAKNTGGVVGGAGGARLSSKAVDALQPYADLLREKEP